jgi:nucleoid DNA-binding protein
MHLNRTRLIDLISSDTGLPKETSSTIVVVLTDTLSAELAQGKEVLLRGFGKFYLRYYRARNGNGTSDFI